MSQKKKKIYNYIIFSIVIVSFISLLVINIIYFTITKPGPFKEDKIIIISNGLSVKQIADLLEKNNIIHNYLEFIVIYKLMYKEPLRSGEYKFKGSSTLTQVIKTITKSKSVLRKITFPEGVTTHEIIQALNEEKVLFGDVPVSLDEGYLLPDTYYYSYGDSRQNIINKMHNNMKEALESLWENRDGNLPYKDSNEALVMASIIEKESSKASELKKIASVYLNRLNKNMKLQADPTVIYAITGGKGPLGRRLTYEDLKIASEYNTYYMKGLPPKPICNPGLDSLEAALKPEKTEYIYFVADGRGGHIFSKTYDQHQKHVNNYRKILKNRK